MNKNTGKTDESTGCKIYTKKSLAYIKIYSFFVLNFDCFFFDLALLVLFLSMLLVQMKTGQEIIELFFIYSLAYKHRMQ